VTLAAALGKAQAESLGFDADDYDPDQTLNFLKAVATRYATTINETTKTQLDEADEPATVFETAKDSRATSTGVLVATFLSGFASVEAGKQIAQANDVTPTKTWVTGSNPRPEHSRMDGETVPLDDKFSDGNDWPGGLPGCNCSVDINL
jgi:hypothetical protein